MGVFKTYDIRGIYGEGINKELAYKVGRAFAQYLGKESYLVGHDARLFSRELYEAAIGGLLAEGKKVTGLGLVSTPYLHYSQIMKGFDGGLMVTASHNPPPYHGFKLYDSSGGSVSYARGLDKIEAMVMAMEDPPLKGMETVKEQDWLEEYLDFVAALVPDLDSKLKVVVDPSNGSSGRIFRKLLERLNVEGVVINEEADGNFPNHDPNPLKFESRVQLSEKVLEFGADLGIVLDGDGDRIICVDEKGRAIENYFLSCLIAEELLGNAPGSVIVYDLISSRVLPERITELKGEALLSKVGYTYLYDKMVETGALFGTETSGHVYFKVSHTYYTESAAYALVVLLKLLDRRGKRLSELVKPLAERYFQSGEINIEIEDKEGAMQRIEENFTGGRISRLDGVSVEYDDFWFNIRPSNTEPLLRLRLEARSKEVRERRTEEVLALVNQ